MRESSSAGAAARIRGALIGCAYGDAMGMPTEYIPHAIIRERHPEGIEGFVAPLEGGAYPRDLRAGEVTDDTVNTLLVAEMLIERAGEVDARGFLDHIRAWVARHPDKYDMVSGPSTRRALDAIERGVPLERAGITGTTNGAAMKISPVGAICDYRDLEGLVDRVEQVCLATHNTGIAIAGASAVAACVSYGVAGGDDAHAVWEVARDAARAGARRGFAYPTVDLCARMACVRDAIRGVAADRALALLSDVYGTGVETCETVPAVLSLIELAEGDPVRAAEMAAGLGGDTDTIGAIAAAICGTMHPEAFPAADVALLEDVNGIDFDGIARALAALR